MDDSTFVSPSTGRNVKAVLFDTFGTVVDWRAGVAREAKKFANRHGITFEPFDLTDKWRAGYYPSVAPIRSGDRRYVPLDQRHLENLKTTLAELGFPPSDFPDNDLQELNRAWESLPAWPDSVEGVERLKARYIVGPLSNANTALLVNMAKYARLPWDVVIGLDLFQVYKPDPAAYTGAAAVLRLHPGEACLPQPTITISKPPAKPDWRRHSSGEQPNTARSKRRTSGPHQTGTSASTTLHNWPKASLQSLPPRRNASL